MNEQRIHIVKDIGQLDIKSRSTGTKANHSGKIFVKFNQRIIITGYIAKI